MFSEASVSQSVHEGEGSWLPSMHHRSHDRGVCIQGGLHPGGVGHTPLEIHGILRDTVNKRAVLILLECILVQYNVYDKENPFTKNLRNV